MAFFSSRWVVCFSILNSSFPLSTDNIKRRDVFIWKCAHGNVEATTNDDLWCHSNTREDVDHFGISSHETDTNEQEVKCMARQQSLDILASGKKQWNTWRQTYPDVQAFEPDLHEADLCKADLSGIDFHDADLTEANLQRADLRHANLQNTDLRHTNLQNADLSDANLYRARLHGAELRGAKLCRANLTEADLSNADLRGADLLGADLTKAILKHAQFDETKASAKL